ncbi:MAG: helix-turn-helix domain-containing protein [Actinomycetota bacterium]|nr:helix-turn-helix domain-containing protein [Actinomycetota bacterium]
MSNQVRKQSDHVQSLARGLLVLKTFSSEYPVLTLAEAARLTGLARATVRRSLHTLQELGYVTSDGRQFELTPRVLDLGFAYLHSAHIGDITQPYIESLSDQINESVSMAVLDGFDIIYIARVPTKRIMRIGLSLGSRLPALVTSMGRMIVADLPDEERKTFIKSAPIPKMTAKTLTNRVELLKVLTKAHERGWVMLDQELEDGVRSIAAPIRDKRGRTIAAINIGTQSGRVSTKQLSDEFLPLLINTAANISSALSRH